MQAGDVVFMTTANVVSQDGSVRMSFGPQRRGDRMIFMLLGSLRKDAPNLDHAKLIEIMAALGWQPIPNDETEDTEAQG